MHFSDNKYQKKILKKILEKEKKKRQNMKINKKEEKIENTITKCICSSIDLCTVLVFILGDFLVGYTPMTSSLDLLISSK